jgi:hypothetical protein
VVDRFQPGLAAQQALQGGGQEAAEGGGAVGACEGGRQLCGGWWGGWDGVHQAGWSGTGTPGSRRQD